jgi:hypothetical protein
MATKNFSALLTIGGAVDGSLGAAVSKVRGQIDSLGSTMKESNAGQRSIKAFVGAQGRVTDARANVREEMKKLADLQGQAAWVSSAEDLNQLNKEIDKQKTKVAEARAAVEKQVVALDKAREACKAAGIDTEHLSEENERLGKSAEEAKTKITALKDAASAAHRDMAALGTSWGRLKSAGVAAVASTAALGTAIWKTAHGFFEFADDAQETADALGMTVQQFQALEYAGSRVGVKNEQMATSLNALNHQLAEAAAGSKGASTAFDALGLDASTLQMMDAEQRMELLAEAFRNYDGPISNAALANDLFGKGGYKMANVLSMGAEGLRKMRDEGKNTGFLIDPKQQEIAEKFDAALGQLGATVQGIRNQFGAALLPTLTRVFDFLSRHTLIVKAAFLGLGVAIGGVALISLVKFGIEAKKTIVILQSLASKIAVLNALQTGGAATQSIGLLGRLGGAVKAIIPGLATLGSSILPMLAAGFAALGAAIMTTPIGWIIGGIALLGLAIVGIIKFWQPIKAFFIGIGQAFSEAFAPLVSTISPAFASFGELLRPIVGWFKDLLTPIQYSSDALGKCTSAGFIFGKVLMFALSPVVNLVKVLMWGFKTFGAVAEFALNPVVNTIKGILWGVGKIGGWLGLGGDKSSSVSSPLGETAGSTAPVPMPATGINTGGVDNTLGNTVSDKDIPALGASVGSERGSPALGTSVAAERGTPAPVPMPAAGNAQVNQNNNISITVTAQPGQSAEDIARKTADEIERRTARAQRAALYDTTAAYAY